eukprot:CAMPEP_0172356814 /NCGR_PEP_ID=MMETSP1060-20121228/1200_1 /TAXON_ID=37318 /ORGANISM="Pseudo-nitzschia pungens, Strain cf. cingulata" /LENGTH=264 /DNA_ID=CAMNT_0013077157 /DNA_START=9 /DNA_END=803 /DNA_ORIENTATION=+
MVQSLSYMLSLAVLVVAQLATIANAQGEMATTPNAQGEMATIPNAQGEMATMPNAQGEMAMVDDAQGGIINVYRWIVPYTGPKEFVANVGDTIVFRWTQSQHNVFIHPTMSCDLTGAIEVGQTPGSEYTFSPADGGTEMFFSCDFGMGSHCVAGQFLTVTVLDNSTDTSTEFPATEAPTDAPTDTLVASPTDAPVDPAPVDPAPIDPAPVDPAPVDPAPVDPAPVDPAPVDPANAMSISSSAGRRSVIDMALALVAASLALVVF